MAGTVWHGMAWYGMEWHGMAWRCGCEGSMCMCVVLVEHVHVCEHGYCGATGGDQSHRRMCVERYVGASMRDAGIAMRVSVHQCAMHTGEPAMDVCTV